MKKILIILFQTLTILLSSSCKPSVYREYYDDGTLKEEYFIRNGKFTGTYKQFYSSGELHAIGHFRNNKMDNTWKYYYPSGRIQSIQKYDRGDVIQVNFWEENGKQSIANGTGIATLYYSNGSILSRVSVKNNVFHGKCETWYENGVKATEFYYENGRPVGTWKYWDDDGILVKTERN